MHLRCGIGIQLAWALASPSGVAGLGSPLLAAPELDPWALIGGGLALLAAGRLARNRLSKRETSIRRPAGATRSR